ncbi:MAG: hypothetical protein ACP5D1_11880 [Bacteroidales bacterium]
MKQSPLPLSFQRVKQEWEPAITGASAGDEKAITPDSFPHSRIQTRSQNLTFH